MTCFIRTTAVIKQVGGIKMSKEYVSFNYSAYFVIAKPFVSIYVEGTSWLLRGSIYFNSLHVKLYKSFPL